VVATTALDDQTCASPPSTGSSAPVTYDASDEPRNATVAAISSGPAGALERNPGDEALGKIVEFPGGRAGLPEDRSLDRSGGHRVDADAARRQLVGQGANEVSGGRLGGGVERQGWLWP